MRRTIYKTLLACGLLILAGCRDNSDDFQSDGDNDEDFAEEMSANELLYSNLAGALYSQIPLSNSFDLEEMQEDEIQEMSYSPSRGAVLNEGNPYIRYEIAETYEEALKDFSRLIPTEKEEAQYLTQNNNEIIIAPTDYGTVTFHADNSEGAVAVVEVSLKDYHPHRLYYLPQQSLGENYSPDENLDMMFNSGDVISFRCPECGTKYPENIDGLVVEVSSHACYVLTDHIHSYQASDHWKKFIFIHNLVSIEDCRQMKDAWNENSDLFIDASRNSGFSIAREFVGVMKDWAADQYVVIDGNDIGAHKELYWARWTWYSKVKILKVSDLRAGKYSVNGSNYYAYRKQVKKNSSYHYFSMLKLLRSQVTGIVKHYPKD